MGLGRVSGALSQDAISLKSWSSGRVWRVPPGVFCRVDPSNVAQIASLQHASRATQRLQRDTPPLHRGVYGA